MLGHFTGQLHIECLLCSRTVAGVPRHTVVCMIWFIATGAYPSSGGALTKCFGGTVLILLRWLGRKASERLQNFKHE